MGCDGGKGRGRLSLRSIAPGQKELRREGRKEARSREEEEGTVNLNLNRPLTQWGFGKEREEEFKGKGRTRGARWGRKVLPSSFVNQLNIGSVSLTRFPKHSRT